MQSAENRVPDAKDASGHDWETGLEMCGSTVEVDWT